MILQLSCKGHGIGLRLPAPISDVKQTLSTLRDGFEKNAPVRISSVCGNAYSLHRYIRHADLENEDDLQKLNRLAELFDGIGVERQHILSGALDAESINGLDDVLRIASDLAQYEIIEGVTSDKALGGWLVEHGLAGVDFPEAVRPYLDYAGIGAEYYASHGGAYTPTGYVKRQESTPEQTLEDKSRLSLTLRSGSNTCHLAFPASDAELETARRKLGVAELTDDRIDSIMVGYSWANTLPLDDITLEGFNTLAQYVQQMSESELRLFGAALEAEEPETFSEAVCIAEDLDDYELVDGSEEEYGREALRHAGAGDVILDMLDGFTDFDTLGRFEMEQDGVLDTGYGQIKRLSSPFPRQAVSASDKM